MNKKYKKYLLSAEWAQVKIDLYTSRGRRCQQCGGRKKLQVHHKTYKNIFKEEPNDLIILCDPCHRKEHPNKIKIHKPIKIKKRKKKNKNPHNLNRRDRKLQKHYDILKKRGFVFN